MVENFIILVYIFKGVSEAQLKRNLPELMQHLYWNKTQVSFCLPRYDVSLPLRHFLQVTGL